MLCWESGWGIKGSFQDILSCWWWPWLMYHLTKNRLVECFCLVLQQCKLGHTPPMHGGFHTPITKLHRGWEDVVRTVSFYGMVCYVDWLIFNFVSNVSCIFSVKSKLRLFDRHLLLRIGWWIDFSLILVCGSCHLMMWIWISWCISQRTSSSLTLRRVGVVGRVPHILMAPFIYLWLLFCAWMFAYSMSNFWTFEPVQVDHSSMCFHYR